MVTNNLNTHEYHILQCISLALKGEKHVAPNPMVGCIIVHQGKVIGQGHHEKYGGPHAEVNAINAVHNQELLQGSTLYVNLEPCSHHGKTPPCTDLIIEKKIKTVVIGTRDPFPAVSGKGVERLKSAGVEVIEDIGAENCRYLNRKFFSFYEKNRPYIILKWAQTADGFIAPANQEPRKPLKISNSETQRLVHSWRAAEQAILVGKHTILNDDPQLNVRLVEGKDPIPFILGSRSDIPDDYHILGANPVFFENKDTAIEDIIQYCVQHKILSILVEGGAETLSFFISNNYWNEARIIINPGMKIKSGIAAPLIAISPDKEIKTGNNIIQFITNPNA